MLIGLPGSYQANAGALLLGVVVRLALGHKQNCILPAFVAEAEIRYQIGGAVIERRHCELRAFAKHEPARFIVIAFGDRVGVAR